MNIFITKISLIIRYYFITAEILLLAGRVPRITLPKQLRLFIIWKFNIVPITSRRHYAQHIGCPHVAQNVAVTCRNRTFYMTRSAKRHRDVLQKNVLHDTFCRMSRDVPEQNVLDDTFCRVSRDVMSRTFWQNYARTKTRTFWVRVAFGGELPTMLHLFRSACDSTNIFRVFISTLLSV